MSNISESRRKEIERYIVHDLDVLYATIDLISSSKEPVLYCPGNEITRGLAKFNELAPILRGKICKEWDYCGKRHDLDLNERVDLVAMVADVIAGLTIGFPPVLISVILVKIGLTTFCQCQEIEKKLNNALLTDKVKHHRFCRHFYW